MKLKWWGKSKNTLPNHLLTEEEKKERKEDISLKFKHAKFHDIEYVREIFEEEEVLKMISYGQRMGYFALDYKKLSDKDKIDDMLFARWARSYTDYDQTKGEFIIFKERGNYHLLKNREDFFEHRTGYYVCVRTVDILRCIWHNQPQQYSKPIERRGGF